MDIKFYAPRWGSERMTWHDFANKVSADDYNGVEVFPLQTPHEKSDLMQAVTDKGLELALIQSVTENGKDFESYKSALARNLYELAGYQNNTTKPQFINSHTGREYYTKDQVAECFAICERISEETGIKIMHETHRNKWTYAAHVVKNYLEEFPQVRLALDISHWVCVSESYLQDQDEAVELALQHTDHLHARVGHIEGPQVTDPRAPENAEALQYHLKWWDRWVSLQAKNGAKFCTITPEFGPHPYMSYQCNTNTPVADQWEINLYIKNLLRKRYLDQDLT